MNISPGLSESNLYSVFVIVSLSVQPMLIFITPFVLKKAVELKEMTNGNGHTSVDY